MIEKNGEVCDAMHVVCNRCEMRTADYSVAVLPDTGRTELCAACAAQHKESLQ